MKCTPPGGVRRKGRFGEVWYSYTEDTSRSWRCRWHVGRFQVGVNAFSHHQGRRWVLQPSVVYDRKR